MVNAYLTRFRRARGREASEALDQAGYTRRRSAKDLRASASTCSRTTGSCSSWRRSCRCQARTGSASTGVSSRSCRFSTATSDGAFAIDADRDEVVVRALRRLSGLDYEEFEDLLETVGKVADQWDDTLRAEFKG